MPSVRRLAAIMFSDIMGYTAMMQKDEADAVARVKRYRQVLGDRVAAHHGEILQHYGDGSLSIFASAVEAVKCAREIQIALREAPQVPLRIGIHIGDVVREGDELYGDGVNLASRVQSLAPPGAVLFTARVWEDIRSHPEFRIVEIGNFTLKNVERPMAIYGLAGEGFPSLKRGEFNLPKGDAKGTRIRSSARIYYILAGAIILAAATFTALRYGGYLTPEKTPAVAHSESPSIAVLPFKDMSPERDQAYFGDGIAEEILNALTHVEGLRVAGRTSSFSFRDEKTDVREIGKQLGVSTILEGSVRKAGDQLRITAQLINAKDGFHLWSSTYDRQISDIFTIQEEIAQAVVNQLAGILVKKKEQSLVKPSTQNQAAYESYLRGKYMLSQRAEGVDQALAFFSEAIALDSQFALAYAGLGNTYLWQAWSNMLPSDQAFPKARLYAQQALRYDSTLAYAHAVLGAVNLWYDWKWQEARSSLELAIRHNPSEARAYLDLGWYHAISGNFDEAIGQIEKAVSLDPFNLEYNVDLADMHRMAKRYDRAEKVGKEMLALYPSNSETHWILGLIAYTRGQYVAAERYFQQCVDASGGEDWTQLHLAMAKAKTGNAKAAQKIIDDLLKAGPLTETAPVELAMAYLSLNQQDKALAMLEDSYKRHANWLISIPIDPFWDTLRSHPRFKALVRKMDFPGS
ncbi:MAG: tetratricopeptide repeat protein [Saprospiraceae bacterium]|nr:tetratricopeptide repeat protein [Saprospiraceae bacterium]